MRTMITVSKESRAWLRRYAYSLEIPLGEMYQVVFNFYVRLRNGKLTPKEIKEVEEYWNGENMPVDNNVDKILIQSTIALDGDIRDQLDEFADEDEAGTLTRMYQIVLDLFVRMKTKRLTEKEQDQIQEWWYKSKK